MDLFRVIVEAGRGGGEDSEEEDGLLENEDCTSSEEEEQQESEEDAADDATGEGRAVGSGSGLSLMSRIRASYSAKSKQAPFDKSLPAQHLYLGDMEEEGHPSVQEDETTPLLPLLYFPGRVLFPGETLPMHIYNPHAITMLRHALTTQQPVAVCADLRDRLSLMEDDLQVRPKRNELAAIGTTADIVACREDEEGFWFHGPRFIVKFVGRQRFRLMECYKRTNGLMDCRVQILSECVLPTRQAELFSCPAFLHVSHAAVLHEAYSHNASPDVLKMAANSRKVLKSPRMSQTLCQAPGWLFHMYEFDYLREKLVKEQQLNSFIGGGGDSETSEHIPDDVTTASYWLARRLPISDESKLTLLSIDCPTVRLIRGLDHLRCLTELFCSGCGTMITKKEHIFSMSVDGPLAAYVNPAGYIHDTLTVSEAVNLKAQGRGSTENSWFPGYQWTILNCARCREHKGWCFEAVKRKLSPKKFFGLRRSGLVISPKQSQANQMR